MISGIPPRPPLKVGTRTTIDMQTGEIVEQKPNAAMLVPPHPDVCQECAVKHAHDEPHNQQSVYYQMAFYATHGRFPNWTDALRHCAPKVRDQWRLALIAEYRNRGKPVPEDLLKDVQGE